MILQERHKIQYLLSAALLFFILGLGNVIYARVKYKEYKGIFKETSIEINENKFRNYTKESSTFPNNNFLEKKRHLKRSKMRITFYKTFVTGGKILLSFSFFLLVLTFIIYKKKKKD